MNLGFGDEISPEPDEERPEATETALQHDRHLGYRDGAPLVPNDDTGEFRLGDDPADHYDHYCRGDSLFLPDAGEFVRRLFEQPEVGSVEAAAEELNESVSDVERAAELHGINLDEVDSDRADGSERDESAVGLPSGERIPVDRLRGPVYEDARLLHCLLGTWGMSTDEAARYLSEQTDGRVHESDVREAARGANLF